MAKEMDMHSVKDRPSGRTLTATASPHTPNRRVHSRLAMRLPVELRSLDDPESSIIRTVTRNVSTGGIYLELGGPEFTPGQRIGVRLRIPAAEGVSAYPGMITCDAEVLRCSPHPRSGSPARYGLAARFLDKLRITLNSPLLVGAG